MLLHREFNKEANKSQIEKNITQYLTLAGYKQQDPGSQTFKRGRSKFGTSFAFSPKDWGVVAEYQVEETDAGFVNISINMTIDTTGQLVTEKEKTFWENEIANFETAIISGQNEAESNVLLANSASHQNSISAIIMLGTMIIFGCISFFAFINLGIPFTRINTFFIIVIGMVLGLLITNIWSKYQIKQ